MSSDGPPLERVLGSWALTAYGLGGILGAGIYALAGKIAGIAGTASWLAFLAALFVAALTALSYAELGSRFARSAGESYYAQQAFSSRALAQGVGWLVLCSGLVSMATVSHAFAGYLLGLLPGSPEYVTFLIITGFLVMVAVINFRGIRETSNINVVCTIVETTGLLIVIGAGLWFIENGGEPATVEPTPMTTGWPSWILIAQAGGLAFFAFIGFEDMVNVAEEVKNPQTVLPRAILTSLILAGGIYVLVAWVMTSVVPLEILATSDAPLLEAIRRSAPAFPPWLFILIALFAVANTGLLNCVMSSRLLYGMSRQQLLPRWLGLVHDHRKTPHRAIILVLLVSLALALSGSLVFLAGTTSALLLLVFFTVNLSLVVIQTRGPAADGAFRTPRATPILGAVSCLVLIPFLPLSSLVRASIVLLTGALLVVVWHLHHGRRRHRPQPGDRS